MLYELINGIVVATVPILVGWGLAMANRYVGMQVSEAAKDTITEAITSGILAAIAKYGTEANRGQLADAAMAYVQRSAPDSMRVLGNPTGVIRDKIAGKLSDMLG